jgi:hypothetical protein
MGCNAIYLCCHSLVQVENYMAGNGIDIREYHMVQPDVSLLSSGQLQGSVVNGNLHVEKDIKGQEHSKIWIDSNSCCLALYSKLRQDQVLMLQSPIALPKAVKVCFFFSFNHVLNRNFVCMQLPLASSIDYGLKSLSRNLSVLRKFMLYDQAWELGSCMWVVCTGYMS